MNQAVSSLSLRSLSHMVLCNLLGFVLIFASALILPPFLRNMFYGGDIWADPIWFQMFMWIPFFVGISILMQRFKEQGLMLKSLSSKDLLTGAADEILGPRDLSAILSKARDGSDQPEAVGKRIIEQVILRYQTAKSTDQASSMLGSLMDLLSHRFDLQYNFVRYISWLMPSLGFMGTVYGISLAVGVVGGSRPDDPSLLPSIAKSLAIAFDTTLLALVQTSLMLWILNVLESRDERFVNQLSEYVQTKLINRLE
jgi:biopolymer transport protein ExbB/TolQ